MSRAISFGWLMVPSKSLSLFVFSLVSFGIFICIFWSSERNAISFSVLALEISFFAFLVLIFSCMISLGSSQVPLSSSHVSMNIAQFSIGISPVSFCDAHVDSALVVSISIKIVPLVVLMCS